jgi:hypothetical protein
MADARLEVIRALSMTSRQPSAHDSLQHNAQERGSLPPLSKQLASADLSLPCLTSAAKNDLTL